MHWYTGVLKKYAVFEGRATRPEFWWFTLIDLTITIAMVVVAGAIVGGSAIFLTDIYTLAVLLPRLGVTVRRLHDTNHSGWLILISIIPLIGMIVLLGTLAAESSRANNYGPDPQVAHRNHQLEATPSQESV